MGIFIMLQFPWEGFQTPDEQTVIIAETGGKRRNFTPLLPAGNNWPEIWPNIGRAKNGIETPPVEKRGQGFPVVKSVCQNQSPGCGG